MHEKIDHDALKKETEPWGFARAAHVAAEMALPDEEIRNLHGKALGQMAAVYRNAYGTRYLPQQYGFF